MVDRIPRDTVLTIGGVLVAVGVYCPWVQTNPNLPSDAEIPLILLYGMRSGLEGLDYALLGSVGGVIALSVCNTRDQVQTLFTVFTGVGSVLLCTFYLFSSPLIGFDAAFVPTLGWHLTVLGGIVLIVTGALGFSNDIENGELESPQNS